MVAVFFTKGGILTTISLEKSKIKYFNLKLSKKNTLTYSKNDFADYQIDG